MKADHRKELEENALADRLGSVWGVITSNSPQATIVWGAILVGLLALLVYRYYGVYASEANSQIWTQLDMASDVADLKKISAEKGSGEPGRIAKYHLARVLTQGAMTKVASASADDRKTAADDLEQAKKLYTELAASGVDVRLLHEEAMLEAAKIEETLALVPKADSTTVMRGSLDDALKLYDQVIAKYPTSFRGKEAAARAKQLREQRGPTSQFYTELARELNPPPAPLVPKVDPLATPANTPAPTAPADPAVPKP